MNEDPSHVAIWHQKCMSDRTSLSKTITNYRLPNSHTYHDNEDKNCDESSQIHTAIWGRKNK